jgi:hypothetical protein
MVGVLLCRWPNQRNERWKASYHRRTTLSKSSLASSPRLAVDSDSSLRQALARKLCPLSVT